MAKSGGRAERSRYRLRIYRFHTVYVAGNALIRWPTLAQTVLVHGYVNSGGQKMAKSLRANVVESGGAFGKIRQRGDPLHYLLKKSPPKPTATLRKPALKKSTNARPSQRLWATSWRASSPWRKIHRWRCPAGNRVKNHP